MKVKYIMSCICLEKEKTEEKDIYSGMPQLKICVENNRQLWKAFCPSCGRGKVNFQDSPYHALVEWNTLQENLRKRIRNYSITEEKSHELCNECFQ